MAKGYLVVLYRDAAKEKNLVAYDAPAKAAIEAMGGTFIARGLPVETFEIGQMERSVVVEFDSTDAAIKAYKSDTYQAIMASLGALRDVRIIEGV